MMLRKMAPSIVDQRRILAGWRTSPGGIGSEGFLIVCFAIES